MKNDCGDLEISSSASWVDLACRHSAQWRGPPTHAPLQPPSKACCVGCVHALHVVLHGVWGLHHVHVCTTLHPSSTCMVAGQPGRQGTLAPSVATCQEVCWHVWTTCASLVATWVWCWVQGQCRVVMQCAHACMLAMFASMATWFQASPI